MTPFEIALGYLGTSEAPGDANNSAIMAMYQSVGQDWVEHDSVAWCAAFVGHCLEKAGVRSTRKLTARSYLTWGISVELANARQGDIGVIPRGRSAWQGHVFFIDRIEGAWVWGLGGNQSDTVSIKRYPASKLLGIRRAGSQRAAVSLTIEAAQTKLRDLGYHEVGQIDGILGTRTRAALLAFRDDHDLPLIPIIDTALEEALALARPRKIAPSRAEGIPKRSRILAAANKQIGLGALGLIGSIGTQIVPVLTKAEEAKETADRLVSLAGLDASLTGALPWIGAAAFGVMMILALRARSARIDDHRSGRTP